MAIEILSVGKQKHKRVKDLKKGKGALYAQVVGAAHGRDVIVVVVKDKGAKAVKSTSVGAPAIMVNPFGQAIQAGTEAAAQGVRAMGALVGGANTVVPQS